MYGYYSYNRYVLPGHPENVCFMCRLLEEIRGSCALMKLGNSAGRARLSLDAVILLGAGGYRVYDCGLTGISERNAWDRLIIT
jgi:hypothetical protein